MSFKVSTTGTLSPVVLNDLGGRSLVHPIVDQDLALEFTTGEIDASTDIQTALTAGHITVVQDPPTSPGEAVVVEDVGGNAGLPAIDGSQLTGFTDGQIPATIARDAEVTSAIGTHTGIPAAHHAKYTDGEAQTVADTQIATHTGIPAAHHAKYTDGEAVTAMSAKADGNPLNHDRPVQSTEAIIGISKRVTQGETDTGTDDLAHLTALKLATTPRLPTQNENDALVGTAGAPSAANKYATNTDPRFETFVLVADNWKLEAVKAGDNWAVDAPAEKIDDPTIGKPIKVLALDDTTEEGVGLKAPCLVPSGATSVVFRFVSAALAAPGAARTVGVKFYHQGFPDDAAPAAWSAGVALGDIDIPTNTNWQYDEETVSLALLGLVAGRAHRFEWTRIAPSAGVSLVGDWLLLTIGMRFI